MNGAPGMRKAKPTAHDSCGLQGLATFQRKQAYAESIVPRSTGFREAGLRLRSLFCGQEWSPEASRTDSEVSGG